MHRCFELALLGAGSVAPNPMVGAVLLYGNRIIGEGYHQQYGQAHAEVNCLESVQAHDHRLIPDSVLYVSLEPCAHFGKTPPCADLIIRNNIKKVVVGCRDPFKAVDGKGIEKLRAAGVEVFVNLLHEESQALNKRFFTFHQADRPYVILKWAQSSNKKIAAQDRSPVAISNSITNTLVHKWRSEEAAILIGKGTALHDDPSLTNRLWTGGDPLRVLLDGYLSLPPTLKLFNDAAPLVIINRLTDKQAGKIRYRQLETGDAGPAGIMRILHQMQVQSVIVEGGAEVLQSFIDAGYWDEARIITNTALMIAEGTAAPEFYTALPGTIRHIDNDMIQTCTNPDFSLFHAIDTNGLL